MIILLRRKDLRLTSKVLPHKEVYLHDFNVDLDDVTRADLVVYLADHAVRVLKATDWPRGKSMSAAELFQYIAKNAE